MFNWHFPDNLSHYHHHIIIIIITVIILIFIIISSSSTWSAHESNVLSQYVWGTLSSYVFCWCVDVRVFVCVYLCVCARVCVCLSVWLSLFKTLFYCSLSNLAQVRSGSLVKIVWCSVMHAEIQMKMVPKCTGRITLSRNIMKPVNTYSYFKQYNF